jgi:hypothetical protein
MPCRGLAKDNPVLGQPVDLEQRINLCRTERQQTALLPFESTELVALAAFVAYSKTGRRGDTAGPPHRLSTLSRGVAEPRLTAAAAQLPDRDAHRALPNDAPEIVDLELYLAGRVRGLVMETPAVRP